MKKPARHKSIVLSEFEVKLPNCRDRLLNPVLPRLRMGDPFSADNIELFEKQANEPARPAQAHLSSSSSWPLSTSWPLPASTTTLDVEAQYPKEEVEIPLSWTPISKSENRSDSQPAKPFEFKVP